MLSTGRKVSLDVKHGKGQRARKGRPQAMKRSEDEAYAELTETKPDVANSYRVVHLLMKAVDDLLELQDVTERVRSKHGDGHRQRTNFPRPCGSTMFIGMLRETNALIPSQIQVKQFRYTWQTCPALSQP